MWQVVGQPKQVSLLQLSLERGRLAHAYFFTGPPHVGKMTLALNLAQALNCKADEAPCGVCKSCQKIAEGKHADVQIIGLIPYKNSAQDKLRTEIGIDQIQEMQHSASLPPFEGEYKVFIIDGAELLSIEAANCLLKTLEEPTGKIVFIVLAVNEKLLPATVISRCQRLELLPIAAHEVETVLISRWNIEPAKAKFLSKLCHGCLGQAISAAFDDSILEQRHNRLNRLIDIIDADYDERFAYATEMATQFGQSRETVQEILKLWIDWWHDLLVIKTDCSDAITNIDQSSTLMEMDRGYSLTQIRAVIDSIQSAGEQLKQNANPRLVLEVLMLSIPKRKETVRKTH